MKILIAYDIPSDRRRSQVARLLANRGERVQYSVFECDLTPAGYSELQEQILALVNPRRDRIHWYPLCQACWGRARSIGPTYEQTLDY